MTIHLEGALGVASTEMAAFDDALRRTGAGNYNLIRLSSVIPPGARIVVGPLDPRERGSAPEERMGEWGDRLYCVYAARTSRRPHEQVWAGIGWAQVAGGGGEGLFAEHHGHSQKEVKSLLRASLSDMCAGRPEQFTEPRTCVVGGECSEDGAACALVIAKYKAVGWQ